MEKSNSWVRKSLFGSLQAWLAVGLTSCFLFDSGGIMDFTSNQIINSIITGGIGAVIAFIVVALIEKVKSENS